MVAFSLCKLFLLFITTLSALVSASPTLARRATIPGPPPDPPQQPGDGSGEYNSIWLCGPNDWKVKAILEGGVLAFAAKGWGQASRTMNHYLMDVGTDLEENLANMMTDMPEFTAKIHDLAQETAKNRIETFIGPWVDLPFSSDWTVWHAWNDEKNEAYNLDWYYALGEFSYAVTGLISRGTDGNLTLKWKAHMFDRYNWDNSNKKNSFGFGIELSHAEIGHLHKCGSAREYTVRGSSKEQVVQNYNKDAPLPAVDTSGAVWVGWQPAKE